MISILIRPEGGATGARAPPHRVRLLKIWTPDAHLGSLIFSFRWPHQCVGSNYGWHHPSGSAPGSYTTWSCTLTLAAHQSIGGSDTQRLQIKRLSFKQFELLGGQLANVSIHLWLINFDAGAPNKSVDKLACSKGKIELFFCWNHKHLMFLNYFNLKFSLFS